MGCKMLQKKMMIPPHQQSQASKSRAIGGGEDTSVRLSKTVISCWKQASSGSYWILLLAQPAPSRHFKNTWASTRTAAGGAATAGADAAACTGSVRFFRTNLHSTLPGPARPTLKPTDWQVNVIEKGKVMMLIYFPNFYMFKDFNLSHVRPNEDNTYEWGSKFQLYLCIPAWVCLLQGQAALPAGPYELVTGW